MKKLLIMLTVMGLAGCASHPSDIEAAYVSPAQYQNYTCNQIENEMRSVGRRVAELRGDLEDESSADAGQMAVGLILFWPALFFLEGGDGPEAAEYARLRGERDALEQAAIQKDCDLSALETQVAVVRPEPQDPEILARTISENSGVTIGDADARTIRDAYADCTISALLARDETQFSPRSLARKAHSDCIAEFDQWRDYAVTMGANRSRATSAYAAAKVTYVDELAAFIELNRAQGVPLSRALT